MMLGPVLRHKSYWSEADFRPVQKMISLRMNGQVFCLTSEACGMKRRFLCELDNKALDRRDDFVYIPLMMFAKALQTRRLHVAAWQIQAVAEGGSS